MRSAHNPPHQARSSGVAKHHTDALGRASSKPAECAQARRNRPALHLAQRANRVSEMLEDLMRVHDVERVIVHVESVEVADRELDIRTAAAVTMRLLDHVGRHIDAEDPSGR